MHSREIRNQGRENGASMKEGGEFFRIPKCIMHLSWTRILHGAELKAEGRGFRATWCAHALKEVAEGAQRIVKG